jgi:hypothetical protein
MVASGFILFKKREAYQPTRAMNEPFNVLDKLF